MANQTQPTDQMQDNQMNLLARNGVKCPAIGLKKDSGTHYSFASKSHYCHQVKPSEPVNISFQDGVCLSANFANCPVYTEAWRGSLPIEIRGEAPPKKKSRSWWWVWLLLIPLVAILVWVGMNLFLSGRIPSLNLISQEPTSYPLAAMINTPVITATQTTIPAAIASPTATETAAGKVESTPTASATLPFPTLGPFIKTPFGPFESFVIHQVAAGESVGKIADIYNTTTDVIIAVNRLVEDYYFFGETTPTSDPALTPYYTWTPTFSPADAQSTPTKPFIPTETRRPGGKPTHTPTPYLTPDVWTTVLIHPGDILVILPNVKDHSGANQYQAIYISIAQKVDDLANLYNLTPDELRYINDLGPGELIASERWIVVPYGGAGPPPTPVPTVLATIDISFALTPRFGPAGEYLLHMVRPGDNVPQIAALYHTTEDVLRQTNEVLDLQPGDVLVVMPGRIDPEDIRPFGTVLIEEDIPVGILASQMRVFESDLVWYNGLEDDQVVLAGQWLIYPNPEPTPTWTHEPLPTNTWGPGPTATKYVGPTHTPVPTTAVPTRTPHP